MRQRVLIIGSDGILGGALSERLRKNPVFDLFQSTRRCDNLNENRFFLDLRDKPEKWSELPEVDTAFFCAGLSSIVECERNPSDFHLVNVENTLKLSRQLIERGTRLVFLSSNRVFSGEETFPSPETPIAPSTEYGRQKSLVETELLKREGKVLVVRMAKVLNPALSLFRNWMDDLILGKAIHPFGDMVMAPVSLDFAVEVLYRIANARGDGIFQVSASDDISYAAAAAHVAEKLGVDSNLIESVSSTRMGIETGHIPMHSAMDTSRLKRELDLEPEDPYRALDTTFGL